MKVFPKEMTLLTKYGKVQAEGGFENNGNLNGKQLT